KINTKRKQNRKINENKDIDSKFEALYQNNSDEEDEETNYNKNIEENIDSSEDIDKDN
ncbi:15104_t:CDS:1, partial [Racocetra fulgida]